MNAKISRRKIALYAVDAFEAGHSRSGVLREIAAYLVASGRQREAELVVRAIEDELAGRGIVVAHVTVAHHLTDGLREAITQRLAAKSVSIEEIVDPRVIGGVRIETPGKLFDATMTHKILALRQAKV